MLISKLLKAIDIEYKNQDADIRLITDDSRKCCENSVFVCTKKGTDYVKQAVEKGAVLVVSEMALDVNCVVVENARKAFAVMSAEFFDNCHKRLRLIGVTGTNGKTTTAEMIHRIISLSGRKCGLVSTVRNTDGDSDKEALCTTPDPFTLHGIFSEIYRKGGEFCVVECSSQGLHQERLYGLNFETAVLTNIGRDHLDYHEDEESYISAKKKLFMHSDRAVINLDDEKADEFIASSKGKVITYSLKKDEADFTAKCIKPGEEGSDYAFVGDSIIHRIKLNVPGEFNVSNSMAALCVALRFDISLDCAAAAIRSFYGVKGRMEVVPLNEEYKVIIDYAHTPESLRQLLLTVSAFKKGRVIAVFGCGGNRDKQKRAVMGQTVCELADIAIVTSDNPRHENPSDIIDDILSGMEKTRIPVYIRENRDKAVMFALKIAEKNDIILLCGKGHETYQITGNEKISFDEREKVLGFIKKMRN